jgi:pimeloyl-ACP methyl ester carboxylesterase
MEYEDLANVILVGHSYGGMVITGVAGAAPRRIARLVFLDAFTPADGESVFSQDKGGDSWRDGWAKLAAAEGQGWLIPPGTAATMGVTDPVDAAWVEARLCPIPMASYDEPVHIADPAALHIPRSFIWCSAMDWFAAHAQRARVAGWDYRELATGHDAMVMEPDKLAELLVACTRA